MLLVEGILDISESVAPVPCERLIKCDVSMTPSMFNQIAEDYKAVMFCGHGPAPDDVSGLALYRSTDGNLVHLRPSDIQGSCWEDKVFVSTA